MRRATAGAGMIALATLVGTAALESAENRTRIETARWAAELNAKSEAGRAWMAQNRPVIEKRIVPVVTQCLPENGEEVTAFATLLRLSRQGRVLEVLTDVDESLAACMAANARDVQLPEPPRNDYWILLNLAAPL